MEEGGYTWLDSGKDVFIDPLKREHTATELEEFLVS